jgi:hypothetical protein
MSEATARELDRQVAEALGWCAFRWEEGRLYGLPPGNPPPGRHYVHDYAVPLYSSEIGAAWECVRWLEARGWFLYKFKRQLERDRRRWLLCFASWLPGARTLIGRSGDTPAEAIAEAFLAVLAAQPELGGERERGR